MSNHEHYLPNPDKRSDQSGPNPLDAVHKLPAMDQAKHYKQMDAMIKGMNLPQDQTNDYDRLMREGAQRVKNVRDWAKAEVQGAIAKATDTTRNSSFNAYTREQVMKKLLANFEHYGKDELVLLISNFAFNSIVNEVL